MVAPRSLLSGLSALLATVVVCTMAEPPATGVVNRSDGHQTSAAVRHIDLKRWGVAGLRDGEFDATRLKPGAGVVIGKDPDRVRYNDPHGPGPAVAYERGRWYSPWHAAGF